MNLRREFFKRAAALLGGLAAGPRAIAKPADPLVIDRVGESLLITPGAAAADAADLAGSPGVRDTLDSLFRALIERNGPLDRKRVVVELTLCDLEPKAAEMLAAWEARR